jgi:hypothetical protein
MIGVNICAERGDRLAACRALQILIMVKARAGPDHHFAREWG